VRPNVRASPINPNDFFSQIKALLTKLLFAEKLLLLLTAQSKMKPDMPISTILILVVIGVLAGMLSGFVGVGGGMIIVPALVYFLSLTQMQAQGTSLTVLLLPVGILAVMNYYNAGQINIKYALIIGATFVVGSYFGSKYALKLPEHKVKFIFALFMLYVAIKMLYTSGSKWFMGN
jgi:uncharacterized protein